MCYWFLIFNNSQEENHLIFTRYHKMIKEKLYNYCLAHIEQRIANSQKAMEEAQAAANEESKSSAGDKFETGRAMMQRERDKNAKQLTEAVHIKQILKQINWERKTDTVEAGSLVITNQGAFFISISVGKIIIDEVVYFAISMATPMGKLLQGKRVGEEATFNDRMYRVEEII